MVRPLVPTLLRAMLLTLTTVPSLQLGYPMQFKLDHSLAFGDVRTFQFVPTASTLSVDVMVTKLSGSGVAMLVSGPHNTTSNTVTDTEQTTRVWKSFGDEEDDEFNDNGIISIEPLEYERGQKFTVTLWLNSGFNASDCVITVVDTTTSSTSYQLIAGTPINDEVSTGHEKFFTLHVPPTQNTNVVITVNALSGDPDIFVNPSSRGFYHHSSIGTNHPDLAAVWSSREPGANADQLTISHTDEFFAAANGTSKVIACRLLYCMYCMQGSS